jgi:DNA-directed RNA polymerase I subunit RPA49
MLGVHNPRTNSLTLHSAPLHSLSTSIKALKSTASAISTAQMVQQRALLGATFGTKRAIRDLNSKARNKLDHESYGVAKGAQSLMLESIKVGAGSLPTAERIRRDADEKRPIPRPNYDAEAPEEVYDMEDVVTKAELESLDVVSFLGANMTLKDRMALLPHRHSKFINNRIRNLLPPTVATSSDVKGGLEDAEAEGSMMIRLGSKDTKKLRLLMHLSYLLAFRSIAARSSPSSSLDRATLTERLGSPAPVIIDGLLDRYTELQRTGIASKGDEVKVTGTMEIKLMGYLMVVMLKVDKWGTDVGTVADDLKLPPKRFVLFSSLSRTKLTNDQQNRAQELFRSLGCTLLAPTASERAALLASGAAATAQQARSSKRAVLRVPLVFPKETRGAPKR